MPVPYVNDRQIVVNPDQLSLCVLNAVSWPGQWHLSFTHNHSLPTYNDREVFETTDQCQ